MSSLNVFLQWNPFTRIHVGTLADASRRLAFQYTPGFVASGLGLSPIHFPLKTDLIYPQPHPGSTLPGLFDDSIPDGWALLLMDRAFRSRGMLPHEITPLARLAYMGNRGMGALTYEPAEEPATQLGAIDLTSLAANAQAVFEGTSAKVLPQLLLAGGSAGGARPKAMIGLRSDDLVSGESDLPPGFEHWLVKFPIGKSASAGLVGREEYAYSLMARAAGIEMPPTRLLSAGKRLSCFAVQRFDRGPHNERLHAHTFANLHHLDFRVPSSDYIELLRTTYSLTRDRTQLLEALRRMLFNIAAHNRDDHTKNFAFLMDRAGTWRLSPAYDLTLSDGPNTHHTMAVAGETEKPSLIDCVRVADAVGIGRKELDPVMGAVDVAVARWPSFAAEAGLPKRRMQLIARRHKRLQ